MGAPSAIEDIEEALANSDSRSCSSAVSDVGDATFVEKNLRMISCFLTGAPPATVDTGGAFTNSYHYYRIWVSSLRQNFFRALPSLNFPLQYLPHPLCVPHSICPLCKFL